MKKLLSALVMVILLSVLLSFAAFADDGATVTLNGKSVPVWFLDSKAEGESYVTMSMSQGLSVYDGALYVLYESGALCFHDGKEIAPTDRIFKVTLP